MTLAKDADPAALSRICQRHLSECGTREERIALGRKFAKAARESNATWTFKLEVTLTEGRIMANAMALACVLANASGDES